ncbi:carboxypeptidase-like regulatory domain-containing protein [Natronogracilivirga saccharolytica]|uniref:Carboxypeptidase-like regulatory domain-containing protein n=1 Tax=Natronogracilivirga saccharolytica TaxID=2812953 RepID=A0A8J7RJU2_9BACT|nr:carboxypeptidase-like regulatory domain-containing protein [Natronogracilivirga saccharolytica]MBP3191463.1 carboxypeptidase-like regulatory domain-containing protein [Natronogracilivirga saccharolytica]
MRKRVQKIIILLFLFGLTTSSESEARGADEKKTYTFDFTGESMVRVLEHLGSQEGVDLIFDPSILKGYEVYARIRDNTMEEALSSVLKDTSLDYIVLSSGTYVVIRSSRRDPAYGAFAGKVYDAQSGDPLPGATVMLADASGGTASNNAGHFSLGKMKSGSYDIIFSYVGYEPVKITVSISPDEQHRQEIALHPARIEFSPIVVTDHLPLIPAAHMLQTDQETAAEWVSGPGAPGVIQDLSLFRGVQHGLPLSDIHMQGGQSGDHRFFLDDVPVYQPYSMGRLYSAFSPYAIGRVSVEKAGFGVSSGSYIAGKINMNHKHGSYAGQHGLVQADPLNTNVRLSGSALNGDLRLMGAFRHSFWDWFEEPVLSDAISDWDLVDPLTYSLVTGSDGETPAFQTASDNTDIRYRDLHLSGDYQFDRYRSLSFSLYHGQNFVETDLLAESGNSAPVQRMYSRDGYDWQNILSQLRYEWLVTPRLDLHFQASYSSNRLEHSYAMFDDDEISRRAESDPGQNLFQLLVSGADEAPAQADQNIIRHATVKTDLEYSVSSDFSLSGGVRLDHVNSEFDLAGLFYLPALNEQASRLVSTYVNADRRISGNIGVNIGSRFTYFDPDQRIYAEPRGSIQFDRTSSRTGYWSLKLSGGMYRQFVNQFQITNVGPSSLVPEFQVWYHDDGIDQPLSYNTAADLVFEPSSSTTIRLDTYLKIQPVAYITSYHNLLLADEADRQGINSFAEETSLRAYGGGVRIHQSLMDDDLQFLVGYDLSRTDIDYDTQFGRTLPAPWNEPHRLQARVLGHVRSDLSVIARWQGIYGRKWGFRQSYYDFLTLHNVSEAGGYSFMNPEDDRLAAFHQVDLSLIYSPSRDPLNLEIRVDLINILNRRNEIDWSLQPADSGFAQQNDAEVSDFEKRSRRMPGFMPSLSIKLGL